MIALQGPRAAERLLSLESIFGLAQLKSFFSMQFGSWLIARTGYTGEDGLEIMLPEQEGMSLWRRLLEAGVKPAGLGARDTLRLEAGLNLYGQLGHTSVDLSIGFIDVLTAEAQAIDVGPEVARIQKNSGLPVVVGFGINTPEKAKVIAEVADGAVVGSAIVSELAKGKPVTEVLAFVKTLADGAHSA